MEKRKVRTAGTYKDMVEYTGEDKETIQGAIHVVEQAADIQVEVPEKK